MSRKTGSVRDAWSFHVYGEGQSPFLAVECLEFHGAIDASLIERAIFLLDGGDAPADGACTADSDDGAPFRAPLNFDKVDLALLNDDPSCAVRQWIRTDVAAASAYKDERWIHYALLRINDGRFLLYQRYHTGVFSRHAVAAITKRIAQIYNTCARDVVEIDQALASQSPASSLPGQRSWSALFDQQANQLALTRDAPPDALDQFRVALAVACMYRISGESYLRVRCEFNHDVPEQLAYIKPIETVVRPEMRLSAVQRQIAEQQEALAIVDWRFSVDASAADHAPCRAPIVFAVPIDYEFSFAECSFRIHSLFPGSCAPRGSISFYRDSCIAATGEHLLLDLAAGQLSSVRYVLDTERLSTDVDPCLGQLDLLDAAEWQRFLIHGIHRRRLMSQRTCR